MTTPHTPSRAERAALAASLPSSSALTPISRAERFLASVAAHPTPAEAAQVESLKAFKTAYDMLCVVTADLMCLGVDLKALYDHKNYREFLWLDKYEYGSMRALPWQSRPQRTSELAELSRAGEGADDGEGEAGAEDDTWSREVMRRVRATIPRFEAACDEMFKTARAAIDTGLSKMLVYEYTYDIHAEWLKEGEFLPWYWTKPRRLG